MRAQLIEKIGEAIFWIAIALAVCWTASGDEQFKSYVVVTFLAGLALGLLGSFLQDCRSDATDNKLGFWRKVLRFLVAFFIGGAILSLFVYTTLAFGETSRDGVKQTILMVAGIKLALGVIAVLSMKFTRGRARG